MDNCYMYTCCIDKSSLDKCTMGSCWEVVARTVTAYMPSFNKIRSGSVVPEIRLLGQMSPGQMLLGQMLIGQMLIGQIVNRKLLPWYWSNPYMIFTIWNAKCCKELINSFQDYDYLDKCHLDKCPVTNVIRTNVTWEMVYIHEEFTMIGSRGFCDASMVFIASLDEARLLGSLKGWPINGRE